MTNDVYRIPRTQMKTMVESVKPYVTQEYTEVEMNEEEFKDWWLNDDSKSFPFETLESDLEHELTCPRCKETYKLKNSKVTKGSLLHDTKNVCKNFPQCIAESLELYLTLFDNDPEPNK